MQGFNESERKGLIGKIIYYFDNGSPLSGPANQWYYTGAEAKQMLLEYFTIDELKQIYNRINLCEKKKNT